VAPVLLNLLEAPRGEDTVGDTPSVRRSRPGAMAYTDLDIYLEHRDGGLAVEAVHAIARLDSATVEALLARWLHLLETAVEDPDQRVSDLPLLTPADEERLDRLEGTPGAPCATTVVAQFRDRVTEDPRSVAVVDASGAWTRHDVWSRAGAIAVLLIERGVRSGDRVVLALDGTADAVAALVGCWRSGVVPIPVGESQPGARVDALAASAGATLVLDRAALQAAPGEADPADLPAGQPEAPAYVLYTSGSTGRPKGVVVGQAALAASTRARVRAYPDRPAVALIAHDLAFDAGLGIVSWYLWTGGTLVMAVDEQRLDAQLLAELVHRHRVGQLDIVPSHYQLLLDVADPDQLATLALVTLGAEPCPPSLVGTHRMTVPGAALVNEYGPTEATVWALAHVCTEDDERAHRVPIGRPISGVTARVGDAAGCRVPPGAVGELLLSGHLLADGYLEDPETTAERFLQQGDRRWYRTGDRVRWTQRGEADFLGRADEQLKIRGYRIEPQEVEAALAGIDGVSRAAVGAVESPAGTPVLVGWVALTPETAKAGRLTPDTLRRRLFEVVPEWLVPQVVLLVDRMPETTAGKVDRGRLPRPELDPATIGSPPATMTEERVAAIWAELLGHPVGIDQSFFSLGGQSLLMARMVARVRAELAVPLDLRDVVVAPRVRDIAARIDAAAGDAAAGHAAAGEGAAAPTREPVTSPRTGPGDDVLARAEHPTEAEGDLLLERLGRR
jgi:amino acid adenylation domain-containing protein